MDSNKKHVKMVDKWCSATMASMTKILIGSCGGLFPTETDRYAESFSLSCLFNSLLSISLFDRLSDLSFVKQTVVRAPTRTGRNIV